MSAALSDPLKETRRAYEEMAERYNQENHSNNAIMTELTEFLDEIKGDIILDIGSGHGRDSKYFSEKGFTVIGLDLGVELTRIARTQSTSSSFLIADMRYLPFRDMIANGLWVCASFHHLPRRYAPSTLSGFNEILCHAGVVHLSVKKGDFTGFEEKNRYHGKPRFYSYYENEQVMSLLSGAGFRVISQTEDIQEELERRWINILAMKP